MNTFDFVQFSTPVEYIKNPNYDLLGLNTDVDGVSNHSLKSGGRSKISEHDFRLVFNLNNNNATIGFSAKILGNKYPDLISIDNIKECLNLFSSKYGLCHSIDVEKAILWGKCNRLEVTKDVDLVLDESDYQRLNNLVVDTYRWKTLTRRGIVNKNGFGVMRSDDSESIILYGKEVEMAQDKNFKFVTEYKLQDRFVGLTRIETKLNSRKAVRKRFKTDEIISVLESNKNPQIDIIDEVFSNAQKNEKVKDNFIKSQRDRERLSYAREFDFDLGALHSDLRGRVGKNWRRELDPILKIVNRENIDMGSTLEMVESIKRLLI